MVNQQGIWAATRDMTILKYHSAVPLGLTVDRPLLAIDDDHKMIYLRGRTSFIPTNENQANDSKSKSRDRIHIN